MKKLMVLLLVVVVTSVVSAGTFNYSRWSDFTGEWSEISGGLAYDATVTPLVTSPIGDLSTTVLGNYTKNFSGAWEGYGFGANVDMHIHITPDAYFGARFQVAGENVTSFNLSNVDTTAGTNIVVQVLDDTGAVLAQTATGVVSDKDVILSATGLNTSYIDVVLKSMNTVNVHMWGPANAFGVGVADITTAVVPEPATMALMAVGAFGLLRRKKQK